MSDTAAPDAPGASGDGGFARVRERAYEVAADDSLGVAERQRRILSIGREFLGVANGHVERVEGDTHRVTVSVNAEQPVVTAGETFERATVFCRVTRERDAAFAVADAAAEGWESDPAHERHGAACYLGARVTVDSETYGTVCFLDSDPRAREFDPTERAFVELVARLFGRLLSDERTTTLADRARYESLVAAAPDAVIVAETTERRVVEANDAAADLVGRDREALVGRRIESFCPPADREAYVETFESLVAGDNDHRDTLPDGSQLAVRHADGSRVPVEISADVVDLGGDPHVHAVVRDVTERVRRDRVLDLANRVFRHNLRNEMNVVRAGGRTLAAELDGEAADRAAAVAASAVAVLALADKVRTVRSALDDDHGPARADVVAAAERVTDDIGVPLDAPDAQQALVPPQFDAALCALVDNAVEHAGDDPDVTVTVAPEDDVVAVAVDADGPGIPPHECRVLEGAEETPLDHGSGVGTWLVNYVVDAAGGTVETSVDDDGSTVRMYLPRA